MVISGILYGVFTEGTNSKVIVPAARIDCHPRKTDIPLVASCAAAVFTDIMRANG